LKENIAEHDVKEEHILLSLSMSKFQLNVCRKGPSVLLIINYWVENFANIVGILDIARR